MKVKHFLLTVIAMLCCVAHSEAAIFTQLVNGHLVARTDQVGQAGYKGCSAETAEKVPAYIFELQVKNNGVNGTCPVGQGGHWRTIQQLRPETGSATFENIPDGHYRVVCKVGKAIGCLVNNAKEGFPDRSIVFELEESAGIRVDEESRKQFVTRNDESISDELVIFPNPTSDLVTIVLKNEMVDSEINISLSDLLGKIIYTEQHPLMQKGDLSWNIDVKALPAGTYLVVLKERSGKMWQRKLVIMRE